MLKLKHLKVGQEINFNILCPGRQHPIAMRGKIGALSPLFGGHIHIEKGAVSQEEFIVRLETLTQ